MSKIVRVNARSINQLAQIDFKSEHQMEKNRTLESYKKELAERFKEKNELFFGFRDDNELKGYVTLKPFFPGYKHCEIYWLAVKKKYQGQGIGTMLVKFIEANAKKRGFRKTFLYTNEKMGNVRKFYECLGYEFVNRFPGFYGYSRNNTAVLYGKQL